jgi:hypothetical protein
VRYPTNPAFEDALLSGAATVRASVRGQVLRVVDLEAGIALVSTASLAPLHRDQIDVEARCFGQGLEVARIGSEDVVPVGS